MSLTRGIRQLYRLLAGPLALLVWFVAKANYAGLWRPQRCRRCRQRPASPFGERVNRDALQRRQLFRNDQSLGLAQLRTTDPLGGVTQMAHDPINGVLQAIDGNGATITNTYTPIGKLASVSDARERPSRLHLRCIRAIGHPHRRARRGRARDAARRHGQCAHRPRSQRAGHVIDLRSARPPGERDLCRRQHDGLDVGPRRAPDAGPGQPWRYDHPQL